MIIRHEIRPIAAVLLAVALAGGLSSCREDEQGRPLTYEKGVYGGAEDQPLPPGTDQALQQRARYQSF